jgi:DNA mismatch repair protein MutL
MSTPSRVIILPDDVANKIAAGEVVQRPESVVKELLENSLDAGATRLAVTAREGGISFLQVADNGSGLFPEDAVTAFQRHATSKIANALDLEAIRTYGFRGEALAAIAAVARVTLLTRRASDDMATVVHVEGGGNPRVEKGAREQGTTVTVQQLFFNVPARRKFLKSTTTEYRRVAEAVQRVCLARPDVAVKLMCDGDPVFQLAGSDLPDRIVDLFGERQWKGLLPVEESLGPLRITGFVAMPQFGQRNRSFQYLFLNRRFIMNRSVNHAVQAGYEHLLGPGTFPFFLLYLEIDPARVDINVHPAKLEAKFEDEQLVYRAVQAAVRRALSRGDSVPALGVNPPVVPGESVALRFTSGQQSSWGPPAPPMDGIRRSEMLDPANPLLEGVPAPMPGVPERAGETLTGMRDGLARPVWQIQNKYILTHTKDGFLIVDQHVAHERVLYEEVQARMEKGGESGQQLLFPRVVELTAVDRSLVAELDESLRKLGFAFGPFGGTSLLLQAAPADIPPGTEETTLREILDQYRDYQRSAPGNVADAVAKAYACRAAVKAGDVLSEPEMRTLIDRLFRTHMPYVCPHGRPVLLRITVDELDRRFGRA